MNRNTAVTTWRDVCGSDTVMASGIVTGRMLEDFAQRIETAERDAILALITSLHNHWCHPTDRIGLAAWIKARRTA